MATDFNNEALQAYRKEIIELRKAKRILLRACNTARKDCIMALSGAWDKSDEGFEDTKTMLEDAIEQAGGTYADN